LQREYVLAIEILMQAVVVALVIAKEQRRGALLASIVAALDEIRMRGGKACANSHGGVPPIGNRGKPAIERRSQRRDDRRQRMGKVLVLAAAEAMPRHHDRAAETVAVLVEASELGALARRQKLAERRVAVAVESLGNRRPVDSCDARADAVGPLVVGLHLVRLAAFARPKACPLGFG